MRNLLNANFRRLIRGKIFWIAIIFMVGAEIFACAVQYRDVLEYDAVLTMDQMTFQTGIYLGIVTAVFVSLFVGTEYSDGTIRNKLLVGHKRTQIYLANFVTCAVAIVIIYALSVVTGVILGLLWFEPPAMPVSSILGYCGIGLLMGLANTAIFCLIAMLCANKTHTAVAGLLLSFLLLFAAVYVAQMLAQPEYIQQVALSENYSGVEVVYSDEDLQLETVPNPVYLSGVKREVYQFLLDVNPAGQAAEISSQELGANPIRIVLYDIAIIVLCGAVGMTVFRRKDIK